MLFGKCLDVSFFYLRLLLTHLKLKKKVEDNRILFSIIKHDFY